MVKAKMREECSSMARSTLTMRVRTALTSRSAGTRCACCKGPGRLHIPTPVTRFALLIGCDWFTRDPRFARFGWS